ncbi:MAG: MerR family transcriptional regulator [Bacteroidales bacterium]|nr:MerR family transcriptional regulator [Bacteroidales bacterium]
MKTNIKDIDNIKTEQFYTIKDLEVISGIKAHTIRIWEQRYGLLEPKRTDTNIRFYTDLDLKRLLNVSTLINLGYKISKLSKLNADELRTLITNHEKVMGNPLIEPLIVAMINFDSVGFNEIILKNIKKHGVENTINNVVYPLVKRVGMLWLTNSISPAHEHFVSNLLKQLLFAQISELPESSKRKTDYLLFLPENEYHEIGLLYTHYLLKLNKKSVVYLGQDVPTVDVIKTVNRIRPKYLVCFFVSTISFQKAESIIMDILSNTEDVEILVSISDQSLNVLFELPRVHNIDSPKSLIDYLA